VGWFSSSVEMRVYRQTRVTAIALLDVVSGVEHQTIDAGRTQVGLAGGQAAGGAGGFEVAAHLFELGLTAAPQPLEEGLCFRVVCRVGRVRISPVACRSWHRSVVWLRGWVCCRGSGDRRWFVLGSAMQRGEPLPEVGLVLAPSPHEGELEVGRPQVAAHRQLGQRTPPLAGVVDRLPHPSKRPLATEVGNSRRQQGPAAVEIDQTRLAAVPVPLRLEGGVGAPERLDATSGGDDEQDAARLALVAWQPALDEPVVVEFLGQPRLCFGAAVPLQPALDRALGAVEQEAGVGPQQRLHLFVEPCRSVAGGVPGGHTERRRCQGGSDQVGDEAVRLQPVQQLRVRCPVVAPLPAEPLALDAEDPGDEDRPGLIDQPVRLRLAGAERGRRVEAVDHAMAVEEQQPILRATLR
jgi:hypothetical protein